MGVEEEIAYTQGVFAASSDVQFDVQQTIAQGDLVVINGIMAGTNDGPSVMAGQPTPATGKKMVIPVSNTFEFSNGKIVRNSVYYDNLGVGVQLGLMPEM